MQALLQFSSILVVFINFQHTFSMGNDKRFSSLQASSVKIQEPRGQVIQLKQTQVTTVPIKAYDKRKLQQPRQKVIQHGSHKQENRQQSQKSVSKLPKGGAVVVFGKDKKLVDTGCQKEKVLYRHVRESFIREEHRVVQRGNDVFKETKLVAGQRERETKIKKAAMSIESHMALVPKPVTLSIQGNHQLLRGW